MLIDWQVVTPWRGTVNINRRFGDRLWLFSGLDTLFKLLLRMFTRLHAFKLILYGMVILLGIGGDITVREVKGDMLDGIFRRRFTVMCKAVLIDPLIELLAESLAGQYYS